jgi:hypothetical protein
MEYLLRTEQTFNDHHKEKFRRWFATIAPTIQASSPREFDTHVANSYAAARQASENYPLTVRMLWANKAIDMPRNVHNLAIPRPMPLTLPLPEDPKPCGCTKNGTQQCEHEAHASVGRFAKAEALFQKEGNRAFVRKRVHVEMIPFTQGKPYGLFDDLCAQVWARVAEKIETYTPEIGQTGKEKHLAWLQAVTRSVVVNHFEYELAKKRGASKMDDVDDINTMADPATKGGWDAKVRPEGEGSDDRADFDRNAAAYEFGLNRGAGK